MSVLTPTQKDKLIDDLNAVIHDSKEVLQATASDASERTMALRERTRLRLNEAMASLRHAQEAAIDRAKAAGQKTDDYVHDHPWQAVGIAAGVGLLLGMLISRR